MGIVNTTTLYDGNFDFKKATAENLLYGFIVRMPFRFRVASPYHCRFENRALNTTSGSETNRSQPANQGFRFTA